VPEGIADHVLTVVREALANVARHAGATSASVLVSVTPQEVRVQVHDDGRGTEAAPVRPVTLSGGNGLRNLRARARALGGDVQVSARPGGGTELLWVVPIE
jgi:signal transduction histidine kinase